MRKEKGGESSSIFRDSFLALNNGFIIEDAIAQEYQCEGGKKG